MNINEVLELEEGQIFDRKSINIDPKALAIHIVAFANADGGTIAIGISDKTRRVEGVDFCVPTARVSIENIPCIDCEGRENHIILIRIKPSVEVHANQVDEVFMRVGDKSKKLTFEERTQLMYDKGERFFEDKPVQDADIVDIEMGFVKEYIEKIGYSKTPLEYLKENKGFIKERRGDIQISSAAILLFGKNPQLYFPRARVRFIRYEGIEEKFGAEMNVIKDVIFEGNILKMVNDSIAFLDTQIKEKTYLGKDGRFVTEEEYPKFVRQEIVVNAITHRDYSIRGTDIQIKLFDNRIVVESPGRLPGLVRSDNIRNTHFSRNPKIAEFLKAYSFVKEYGEGVDRMCKEMESVGLHAPEYYSNSFILKAIIYNSNIKKSEVDIKKSEVDIKKSEVDIKKSEVDIKKSKVDSKKPEVADQKLSFDELKKKIQKYKYSDPTSDNILKIYNEMQTNEVFGALNIREFLKCSSSTAFEIMSKLRKIEAVKSVNGHGKGRY